jgi:internalin A
MNLLLLTLLAIDPPPCGRATRDVVDLRACWVSDGDMPKLASQSELKKLDLSMTRVSDQGLLLLKPLVGLEELNLRYAELITDEGMSAVKGWKHLRKIDLRGTKVTDTTVGYLGALTTLESIDLGFAQISDNGIELLTNLPHLKELTLGGNKLTDTGIQALRLMPTLEYLDLSGPQRTDSGLWSVSLTESGVASVATLTQLRELRIGGSNVTALSLEQLKKGLPKLERLSLQRSKRITDEAWNILRDWKSLKEIDLKDTKVSDAAIQQLKTALPGCVVRN